VFDALGIRHRLVFNRPDGKNINRFCGSEYPDGLRKEMKKDGADLGIGFDGDGDRVTLVTPEGRIIDGDFILYTLVRHLENHQKVRGAVGTVVSNLGLEKALQKIHMRFYRAPVGDKNVYNLMKKEDLSLGAEPSGHVINRRFQNTGDGLLTAFLFLRALQELSLVPGEVLNQFEKVPQITVNIPVRVKIPLDTWVGMQKKLREFTDRYGRDSRAVVRYSGTESKIRVMLESHRPEIIDREMPRFRKLIESELGGMP
jgi:phosphoglucosamine mutase